MTHEQEEKFEGLLKAILKELQTLTRRLTTAPKQGR